MRTLDTNRLHVRFAGRSVDLELTTLNLRPDASDHDIRLALARHFDCSPAVLDDYVIQRDPQAIIVRPVAIYG
jgi:hypothetical protein